MPFYVIRPISASIIGNKDFKPKIQAMRKISIFILFLGITSFSQLYSQQTSTLKGIVVAGDENYKILGARITFQDSMEGTITDWDGKFSLENNRSLPWKIKIEYIGYFDQELIIENLDTFLSIKMKEDPDAFKKIIICPLPPQEPSNLDL